MPSSVLYRRLPTEQLHPRSRLLDELSIPQLLRLMSQEDGRVVEAVRRAHPAIQQAIELVAGALRHQGRVTFVGAGTSGRLGVLEAAECPPTFHTPPSLIQAMIAGGRRAVFRSIEGAEDRRDQALRQVRRRVRRGDVVIGVSASGVTPYVDAALREADTLGAATILVTCHPGSRIPSDIRIAVPLGPEVLTGSTRLKAGTATKLILNMVTVGAMVRLGKTYGNLMMDVRPTSAKLRARAIQIIQTVSNCSGPAAARCLDAACGHTKVASLMAAHGLSYPAARRRLAQAGGSLRCALENRLLPR